jgi:hypothetical protein
MIKAIELIENKFPNNNGVFVLRNIEEFMIEFAQMHVTEALRIASEKAKIQYNYSGNTGSEFYDEYVDKDSILNAYPLDKIK